MNELKLREALFQKTAPSAVFFLRREPRNFENVTLVTRRRKHFPGFLAIFLIVDGDCFDYYKKWFGTLDRGSVRSNLGIKI